VVAHGRRVRRASAALGDDLRKPGRCRRRLADDKCHPPPESHGSSARRGDCGRWRGSSTTCSLWPRSWSLVAVEASLRKRLHAGDGTSLARLVRSARTATAQPLPPREAGRVPGRSPQQAWRPWEPWQREAAREQPMLLRPAAVRRQGRPAAGRRATADDGACNSLFEVVGLTHSHTLREAGPASGGPDHARAGRCRRLVRHQPRRTAARSVTVEVVFDPPAHARLPSNDQELIDRAVAVATLAQKPVEFLTYDTGQGMRARAAGLTVPQLDPQPADELHVGAFVGTQGSVHPRLSPSWPGLRPETPGPRPWPCAPSPAFGAHAVR